MDDFTRTIHKDIQKETKKAKSQSKIIDKLFRQMKASQKIWVELINKKNKFIDIINR